MSAWLLGYLIGAGVALIFLILFEQYDELHGFSGNCGLTDTVIFIVTATVLWPFCVIVLAWSFVDRRIELWKLAKQVTDGQISS